MFVVCACAGWQIPHVASSYPHALMAMFLTDLVQPFQSFAPIKGDGRFKQEQRKEGKECVVPVLIQTPQDDAKHLKQKKGCHQLFRQQFSKGWQLQHSGIASVHARCRDARFQSGVSAPGTVPGKRLANGILDHSKRQLGCWCCGCCG